MVFIRVKKQSDKDIIGLVEFVHYMPHLLSEEDKQDGIMINGIPEPEIIEGKYSVAYYNYKTNSIFYEYEDIPLSDSEKIESLEKEHLVQERNIDTCLLANVELFEMLVSMVSLESARYSEGGVSSMVEVYVTLILKGKKTLDEVPSIIRSQVESMLKELGV